MPNVSITHFDRGRKMKPTAFVIPWYGDDIRGGAEAECNQLAHCFADAGIPVEVFTTCVKEASADRGKNTLPEGVREESGITVRRFLVRKRDAERFNHANIKLYRNEKVTLQEERAYLEEDINSPAMYAYIEAHREEYEMFIFMPYLYGPAYFGSLKCPDRAVLIPCLHDEGYAYMDLIKERMKCFKKMIFLSKAESELAYRLYDLENVKTAVLGAYVESGWETQVHAQDFRSKYHIYDDFILCAGRKEAGKKTGQLVAFFSRYKKANPQQNIKLVLIGGGQIDIPDEMQGEVVDLGFLDLEDKHNAFAAAFVLCNPSYFESFSIVIMESWLVRRPVLVSEHCKVTTDFCMESNGGLFFGNYPVFEGCLDYLLEHRDTAQRMGENGYAYVMENFTKDVVLRKYFHFLFEC